MHIKLIYVGVSLPECRSKSRHKNSKHIVGKGVRVQIFGKDSNKSKSNSGGN
jgi:hypothetical protein